MRNFFVLLPSFENYGGHEYTFIKPLNFFAKKQRLNLLFLLPEKNKLKFKNKNFKIIFFSKKYNFFLKIISIFFNYFKIKNYLKERYNDNDIIYLDGYSIYFLISFSLFYCFSNQKKIKLILWLRYPITKSLKDKILKFFIYKICNLKNTIFLTENELLEQNIKKNISKIKINKMPSLHNLSKHKKIKKINKKNLKILCPGIYREEKYGSNLLKFIKNNLIKNFKLKISRNFKLEFKNLSKNYLKKLIFINDNLNYNKFINEVLKSDVILLPYKMPNYKYRTSGLFFEAISLNKFTYVSNGTLMEKDLKKFDLINFGIKNWENLTIDKIFSNIQNKKNIKNLKKFSDFYKKINGPKSFSNQLISLCEKF